METPSLASKPQPRWRVGLSERRWALVYAIGVMALTTIPYLIGFSRQGEAWRFSGFVFGVEDGNSYIAKMLSGASGAWLFYTPYTASRQGGVVAFLPYLLLGKLAAPPGLHEQLVAIFHLFRFFCGVLAILATYDFLTFFVERVSLRRSGVILATLGGGLGWLLILLRQPQWLGSLPLEFYSPETFGFLALYGLPHLALARAGLLWGLVAYLKAIRQQIDQPLGQSALATLWNGIKVGGWWLLVGVAQPLSALVMGVVLGLHLMSLAVWQVVRNKDAAVKGWRQWRGILRLACSSAIIPAPFLLYNALAFSRDPFLKAWAEQNVILSPHPLHYLLAYGWLLPLALWGGYHLLLQAAWEGWLIGAWVLALPFLAYAPVNLQRRLPEGIWVALVVLAMKGLETPLFSSKRLRSIPFAVLALGLPSALILLVGGVLTASQPARPLFLPRGEAEAFEFLGRYAKAGEVVLTSYETGNALPAWAPLRVVIGHGPESVGLSMLQRQVEAFFQKDHSDLWRQEFIREQGIRFVFWGPAEGALGDWDPKSANYLKQVYRSEAYEIYEVIQP